jgi:hypothetical protein
LNKVLSALSVYVAVILDDTAQTSLAAGSISKLTSKQNRRRRRNSHEITPHLPISRERPYWDRGPEAS